MARPMPLEAPVTRAARAGMGANQSRPGLLSVAMPLVIIAVLAVVLAAAALVFDGGDEGTAAAPARPAPLAQIVARVEQERGLRFRQVPDPLVVTPEQAQEEALESFDEDYPPARRRADEQVLELLGLLPPGTDLRKVAGVDLRRGGRRLLRPALGAAAGRARARRPATASSTR